MVDDDDSAEPSYDFTITHTWRIRARLAAGVNPDQVNETYISAASGCGKPPRWTTTGPTARPSRRSASQSPNTPPPNNRPLPPGPSGRGDTTPPGGGDHHRDHGHHHPFGKDHPWREGRPQRAKAPARARAGAQHAQRQRGGRPCRRRGRAPSSRRRASATQARHGAVTGRRDVHVLAPAVGGVAAGLGDEGVRAVLQAPPVGGDVLALDLVRRRRGSPQEVGRDGRPVWVMAVPAFQLGRTPGPHPADAARCTRRF